MKPPARWIRTRSNGFSRRWRGCSSDGPALWWPTAFPRCATPIAFWSCARAESSSREPTSNCSAPVEPTPGCTTSLCGSDSGSGTDEPWGSRGLVHRSDGVASGFFIRLQLQQPALLRFGQQIVKRAEPMGRSEEHTSELQSRLHLVCRLLLEKKKRLRHCQSPAVVGRL